MVTSPPIVGSTTWIDFRQLSPSAGGFSELFYDYLYDYDEVRPFFPSNFRTGQSFETVVQSLEARPPERSALVSVMLEQNKAWGVSQRALENITLLGKSTTFAVVTGQQVSLFGGPLYTIFKTITAIKLADILKAKFPRWDFVPVFWLEGEDHDFAEMNHTDVLSPDMKLTRIEYLPAGTLPEKNLGPIGELKMDESIHATFAALEEALQSTEFSTELLNSLKAHYTAGRTFGQAFVGWMDSLFGDYGVSFISPNDARLKKLVSGMFVKEIASFPETSRLVIDRSAELEQHYHAQLKAKSVNLFMFHKGGRYLIEPREHDFSLKGTRHFIQKDELMRIAAEQPELLSPNVVLRPIAQDMLLPTVAYVAGPSEVAYHAQLGPVYERFGVIQPVVYPRASASVIDERIERAAEKYQIDPAEFFEEVDKLTARVSAQLSGVNLDKVFSETTQQLHDALTELRFGLGEVDQTLLDPLEKMKSKMDLNLAVLKEKAVNAQKRNNEVAVRQIERAVGTLLPGGNLQERELSVLYFMNKYGSEFVKWLHGEIDVTGFKHQLLYL